MSGFKSLGFYSSIMLECPLLVTGSLLACAVLNNTNTEQEHLNHRAARASNVIQRDPN